MLLSLISADKDPGGLLGETWAQGGALFLLLAALLWFAWSTIGRERARADEQDKWHREQVMPAFVAATQALTRLTELLPDLVAGRSRGGS
jgi:hypothetical protein